MKERNELQQNSTKPTMSGPASPIDEKGAFQRLEEGSDMEFYARDRMVNHLDATALQRIEKLITQLVVEESPVILDLMASWDSHISAELTPDRVVGLGLNRNELRANRLLDDAVIHDLNLDPGLPFDNGTFDVVLNTVSVDYMTRPLEVFKEVARVLKPGGLFLVIFSNRMFPEKAVRIWRESGEEERMLLVEEYFTRAGAFDMTKAVSSLGSKRPRDDKYANILDTGDPVYAIYAEKAGRPAGRKPRPEPVLELPLLSTEDLARRTERVKETLRCPHCDSRLKKWIVPESAFGRAWDNDFMYICFNDTCPFYVRGWAHMQRQGNRSMSYRLMYNPERGGCSSIPVPSPRALREGIVAE